MMAKDTFPASIERRMRAQIQVLHRLAKKDELGMQAENKPPFVTISRQFGCRAFDLSEALSAKLKAEFPNYDYVIYDKKLLETLGDHDEMLAEMIHALSKSTKTEMEDWLDSTFSGKPLEFKVYRHLAKTQVTLASAGACILIGRGGALTTRHLDSGIHVRLVAPIQWRINTLNSVPDRKEVISRDTIERYDKERDGFVRKYLGLDITAATNYDLVFNNEKLSTSEQAAILVDLIKIRWEK